MTDAWPYLMMAACAAATYLWRGLGVALRDRVDLRGGAFEWIGCVAYALVAGLMARIIVAPVGPLAATALSHRLAAAGIAILAFYIVKRNIFVGLVAGVIALILMTFGGAF